MIGTELAYMILSLLTRQRKKMNLTIRKEPHHINEINEIEETARQDFIDNVLTEPKLGDHFFKTEEERIYGSCEECNELNTYHSWCKSCNATRFRQAFPTWTSNNEEIDGFIQNAQIHAWKGELLLEWYPWETFSDVEKIGQGGYGSVFRAKRKLQRIHKWDQENNEWCRHEQGSFPHEEYVALKTIESLSKGFLDEAKRLQRWAYQTDGTYTTLFGFTKNETTGQYLLVLMYFENGDIRKQLQLEAPNWERKIDIIECISEDMMFLHEAGLIHSNPTQEIQDMINEVEEIRQQNIGIKKEMPIPHPEAIYTSRILTNITKSLATMNFDDFELP
ncbi:8454_t:CDS:2 [Diversispora eburnea]|uniref:8454_t:CDS:1 n=1 Tax=Diversispora eburnea TaxID=1213867 RepID=A0A9N8ZX03_9GLOM|nr:8454_t:CDS:2 [Diversispora eburnea]